MEEELKACPFCGNKPSFNPITKEVACIRYHKLAIGTYTAREWNTRPLEDALQAKLENIKAKTQVMLDCVDYTVGNCRPNEPIGGILPRIVIENIKDAWK